MGYHTINSRGIHRLAKGALQPIAQQIRMSARTELMYLEITTTGAVSLLAQTLRSNVAYITKTMVVTAAAILTTIAIAVMRAVAPVRIPNATHGRE